MVGPAIVRTLLALGCQGHFGLKQGLALAYADFLSK